LAARESSPQGSGALETLCRDYWYPLYAYLRRSGHCAHDCQDLTQEFFCRLLEKRWLDAADPERGKLRTFLLSALKNFVSNEWRRASAQRRGGGQGHVPFDTELAESRFATDPQALAPGETFDRQWALTLLELTMNQLRQEFAQENKLESFEPLKASLLGERGAIDYSHLSKQLGMTEGAVRVAVHRLRKRFREIYREQIAQTLSENADVEAEIRHLAQVLARQ
jgi:RNA polymerase sigma-70 factor (ECF subfamily)